MSSSTSPWDWEASGPPNIVALAAFAARSKMVDNDILRECVKEEFSNKAKLIPLNMQAVDEGQKAALHSESAS